MADVAVETTRPSSQLKKKKSKRGKKSAEEEMQRDIDAPDLPMEAEVEEGQEVEGEVTKENRSGLLGVLTSAVGFDITTITLPVSINEPASFLMRLCEQLQYSDLLDKAAVCENSIERLMYVTAFAISCYTVAERTGKPFNPLLGETFEYVNKSRGNLRFVAEQVSHHPPVGACHAENDNYRFWQSQSLKTKFTGNALSCSVIGTNNVFIKEYNEHYKWPAMRTIVHNIIIGQCWIEHTGEVSIENKTNGEKALLTFAPSGWFSKTWHSFTAEVCDAKQRPCISMVGKWNVSIHARALPRFLSEASDSLRCSQESEGTPPESSPKVQKKSKKQEKKDKDKASKEAKKAHKEFKKLLKKKLTSDEPLWTPTIQPLPADQVTCKYAANWTEHTFEVAELTDEMRKYLPKTDSRLRLDRLALQKNDTKTAAAEKHKLEEKQRAERRKREATSGEWSPRWFKLDKDCDNEDFWSFKGDYWTQQKRAFD